MQDVCSVISQFFYRIKKLCCEELLDSQRSAHERSLSGTCVTVSVITGEPSRYHQDHKRAFKASQGLGSIPNVS